jgi:hypothetical protein
MEGIFHLYYAIILICIGKYVVAYDRTHVTVRYQPQSERPMNQVREVLRYPHYAI